MRISGRATLHDDPDLCDRLASRGKPAKLVMKVAVTRAYFHCARSILRANLWQPDKWAQPMKVSFGKLFAEIMQMDESAAPGNRRAGGCVVPAGEFVALFFLPRQRRE